MNIYVPEGSDAIIDLRAATVELKAVGSITSESARKAAIAELNTAALLDIALSLRVIAAEARAAMPELDKGETVEEEPTERDFLIVGDLVAVDGFDEPGEVMALGFSEGAMWALVAFAGGGEQRVWVSTTHRLVGDERDDDAMQDAAEAVVAELRALNAAADAEGELDDIPDVTREAHELASEIDDDFDGDTHNAAANALDVLKANEAARKAAKKKGGKK